jgi:hypothetical protein
MMESNPSHAVGLQHLLIAISGSFDVVVYEGIEQHCFHRNRSYFAHTRLDLSR